MSNGIDTMVMIAKLYYYYVYCHNKIEYILNR